VKKSWWPYWKKQTQKRRGHEGKKLPEKIADHTNKNLLSRPTKPALKGMKTLSKGTLLPYEKQPPATPPLRGKKSLKKRGENLIKKRTPCSQGS